MKQRNLFLCLILTSCLCLLSLSCNKKDNIDNNNNGGSNNDECIISIYSVNDFHGAIKEKASKIGKYLIDKKNANEQNTVILSAGDMFQGTGLSNLNYGKDVVNIMNIAKFDAMTVGNHEFDWELDTVLSYFDGDETNGEASFPFLGCNVIDKRTNNLPNNLASYTIIERGNLNIGVIGYIGVGLEDSIATQMVENYEFKDPVPIIEEIATDLRKNHDVDIVIASGHDANSSTNRDLANLNGDARIDAIINGHSHSKTVGTIRRASDGYDVPYVQAGSSGEAVGEIKLTYNFNEQKVVKGKPSTQLITSNAKEDETIKAYVEKIISDSASVFERVIGTSGCDLNQFSAATWACNAMQSYVKTTYGECDIAFTNIGGIRTSAFPIVKDEVISVERMYEMMPFDNTIKVVTLKGNVIRLLLQNLGELCYSDSTVEINGQTIIINNQLLDDDLSYRVACVDYIFDKESYPFLKGEDIYQTGVLFRDIMIQNIEEATKNNQKCFI